MSVPRSVVVAALVLGAAACGQTGGVHQRAAAPAAVQSQVAAVASPSPATPLSSGPTSSPSGEPSPAPTSGRDLSAYEGLGTWIDQYSQSDVFGPGAFGNTTATARAMAADGVTTLFLETGSYKHPAIAFPSATARLIRASHAAGIKVVGWYLPLFEDVGYDVSQIMRTIHFRTADGQGFDGFALDIEADLVPPVQRIANFLREARAIRAAVGPSYALGAIIPSPRGLIRVPSYWPGFPYDRLSTYFDVVLPMSYFTFHYHGAAVAGRYIRDNVEIIRQRTGDPSIPIHPIGGIVDDMSLPETAAFVRAVQTEHVIGASLYEFPGTSAAQWRLLAAIR